MLAALCLAFLPAVTTIETKTPRDVERRAFEGVKAQYEKRFPGRHLSFGNAAECLNLGHY